MLTGIKRLLTKSNARTTLISAFNAVGIYLSMKNSGGKELRRYPKIHAVEPGEESTRFVFTLPNGFDPKDVAKKEFAFKQIFGRHIELKGDLKRYVLTVYKSGMPTEFKYRYDEIKEAISQSKLPIVCGKDRNGQLVVYDMRDIPHLLIGGATGSGKSTQLRQLLTTLIIALPPSKLQLYLADLKKAEFHIFRNVEHVKSNVTLTRHVESMLDYISEEMDRRSDLLDVFGVAHIDDLPTEQHKPYIVCCIDEFVMLRKNKEVMAKLIELTALGRALGIFVILSMQRPVKDVLDTTIRSNLNVAMGFRVRDAIESRVLNTPGSEKIDVPGRFYMDTNGIMSEIQSPLLGVEEAKRLLEPFRVAPTEAKDITETFSEEQPKQIESIFGQWEE